MPKRNRLIALGGAAVGLTAGIVAERVAIKRRRREDPEADEPLGTHRGDRNRFIDLEDGARIFVEESGPSSRRGVIFIHGSTLRTDVWHYQMSIPKRRLIFYDLRGHGLSQPKGESEYSIETLTQDLLRVIEEAKLEEVVLVGHSVGGMIALHLCARHRELLGSKVKGLVLAHTTYRPAIETIAGGASIARLERVIRRPFDAIGGHHQRIDRFRHIVRPTDAIFWGVSFAGFGPDPSAKQVDFTYEMVAETTSDVVFDLFKAYRGFDVSNELGTITVPCLVLTGAHDRLTVPEASRHLVEHLPKAELHVFEDAGHMSMLEEHEDFNALVEAFLDDTMGR
jgi:pimeloyl-ACP methyl ester carboxylesterase